MKKTIGIIGSGWLGSNYADNFERRGYDVTIYSLDEKYKNNKEKIKECDITFICVPTPTTPEGFDSSIIEGVFKLIGKNKTAVIKSTIVPGMTKLFYLEFPDIYILHSPEFLTEATAKFDVDNPSRNLIGIPEDTREYSNKAKEVLEVLPKSNYNKIMDSNESELYKYIRNCFFVTKLMFMNVAFDLAEELNCNWSALREIMSMDEWIGENHTNPIHKGGRGAANHCLLKDMASFTDLHDSVAGNVFADNFLDAIKKYNNYLLQSTGKDLDILHGVYGVKDFENFNIK